MSPKKLKFHRLVQGKSEKKTQKNTYFSWKISQISNCRFFENSKSTDVIVGKYWTCMLVCLKEILGSRLFLNVHLTVPCELD